MSNELLYSAGVAAKAVSTTPLNLLHDTNESYEIPAGQRWRLNVAAATVGITVKVYARTSANATCGLVEITALATTVAAGATATIAGDGECAQTLKVMGYTAAATSTVNASMIVGS